MKALKRCRDGLVRGLERILSAMVAALTLDVLWGVFTRFVLGGAWAHRLLGGLVPAAHLGQAPYTDELACVLLVWISMLGAALAFGRGGHLGVDFFVNRLHPSARRAAAALVQGLIIALAAAVFVAGGWELASAQMGQELPTMRWLSRGEVYLALPVAGVFIILFSAEHLAAILRRPAGEGADAGAAGAGGAGTGTAGAAGAGTGGTGGAGAAGGRKEG